MLARYLQTTAEDGSVILPSKKRSKVSEWEFSIDGRVPFDGNYFISALASVDLAKGA